MATINVLNTVTSWGSQSWTPVQGSILLGGTNNPASRVTFPTLSGGGYITSLVFNFYKATSGLQPAVANFYATTNSAIVGDTITTATAIGGLTITPAIGWKTFTFTRAAMDVIQGYTGTWYFLMKGRSTDAATYWTGGQGTNACNMTGVSSDASIRVNIGGTERLGTAYINIGGTERLGVAYINIGGTQKRGV